MLDAFSGIKKDPLKELEPLFEETTENPVIIKDITFYSMCEHHLLPFWGKANIGYIPSNKIVGLSKISRALDVLAKRPQVQERLTNQMKDCLITKLNPQALIVYIEAEHLCMTMRGIKQPGSSVITIAQFKSSNEQNHNLELLTSMIK